MPPLPTPGSAPGPALAGLQAAATVAPTIEVKFRVEKLRPGRLHAQLVRRRWVHSGYAGDGIRELLSCFPLLKHIGLFEIPITATGVALTFILSKVGGAVMMSATKACRRLFEVMP